MRLRILFAALALAVGAVGCTPEQITAWLDYTEPVRGQASAAGLDNDGLAALRWCESRGDYTIVNATGKYRGAYQFGRTAWDYIAAKYYPAYVGTDPAAAPWWVQDFFAQALWVDPQGGPGAWPVCHRNVG